METKNGKILGGKRENSGRKKHLPEERKVYIGIYVDPRVFEKMPKKQIQEKFKEFVDSLIWR